MSQLFPATDQCSWLWILTSFVFSCSIIRHWTISRLSSLMWLTSPVNLSRNVNAANTIEMTEVDGVHLSFGSVIIYYNWIPAWSFMQIVGLLVIKFPLIELHKNRKKSWGNFVFDSVYDTVYIWSICVWEMFSFPNKRAFGRVCFYGMDFIELNWRCREAMDSIEAIFLIIFICEEFIFKNS